jgi:hypothetical protein
MVRGEAEFIGLVDEPEAAEFFEADDDRQRVRRVTEGLKSNEPDPRRAKPRAQSIRTFT